MPGLWAMFCTVNTTILPPQASDGLFSTANCRGKKPVFIGLFVIQIPLKLYHNTGKKINNPASVFQNLQATPAVRRGFLQPAGAPGPSARPGSHRSIEV